MRHLEVVVFERRADITVFYLFFVVASVHRVCLENESVLASVFCIHYIQQDMNAIDL